MNMIKEFFNYFMSVLMGRRDSLTAFTEPLTMGERYLRWGMESRDIRDFRSAMDHLHLCHDRDAPMASLLIRKYNCIGEITTAAVETLMMAHQRIIDDAMKTEDTYREELQVISKKVNQGRDYIRKLRDEGSLIKAKNEESRITDLEANAFHLQEMLESGESRTEIFESYDRVSMDAARFFRELDHASAMVLANSMLGASGAETLATQLRGKLDYLKERMDRANPINSYGKTADSQQAQQAQQGGAEAGEQEAAG